MNEGFGYDRISSLLSAVGKKPMWRLEKAHPIPREEELFFDSAECESHPEDFTLALAVAERAWAIITADGQFRRCLPLRTGRGGNRGGSLAPDRQRPRDGRQARRLKPRIKPRRHDRRARADAQASHDITWVETVEALHSNHAACFDIAFVDFFLSKDHSYGPDALPDVSADIFVGFSSKLAAASVLENVARRLGFRITAAIEKNEDSLYNPALEEFLGAFLAGSCGSPAGPQRD
ncbi:MAG TPA: hypothetical protein VMX33_08035 [bacterium]|nr:hypothetical protein [bacterium]